MLEGKVAIDRHLIQWERLEGGGGEGGVIITPVASCQGNRKKLLWDVPLGSTTGFTHQTSNLKYEKWDNVSWMIFLFLLVNFLPNNVLMFQGEIHCWSHLRVKELASLISRSTR